MTKEEVLSSEITLRAYAGKQMGRVWFTPVRDSLSGKYLGIPETSPDEAKLLPRQWDPNNAEFGRYVSEGLTLKPSSAIDVYDWEWLKHNKEIACSIDDARSNEKQVLFYIDDPGLELRKRKEKADLEFQAMSIIRGLTKQHKVDMLRFLGTMASIKSDELELDDLLQAVAKDKPKSVVDAHNDPRLKDKLFIYALMDARKIKKDSYGGYRLGDSLIGNNMDGAVQWLSDPRNGDIVARLFMDLKQSNPLIDNISIIDKMEADLKRSLEKPTE